MLALLPQQAMVPSVLSPQVCALPALTAVNVAGVGVGVGVDAGRLGVVSPSPLPPERSVTTPATGGGAIASSG